MQHRPEPMTPAAADEPGPEAPPDDDSGPTDHLRRGAPERVSGVVLAGGASRRFGSDKLAAIVDQRPLLHNALAAVASVTDELIVVCGAAGLAPLPGDLGRRIRIVRDDEPGAGPLAALETGLRAAVESIALVVGGDMPLLHATVLNLLVRRLELPYDACALEAAGHCRPLPSALRRDPALAAIQRVRLAGGSSLRALLEALAVDLVAEDEWRALDPDGRTLIDIDSVEDLRFLAR